MLQLHNLLVSKWRQWRRKPSVFCGIMKQNHRLSIRRSSCNKFSLCWSVLMCCKKTSWVYLNFEKKKLLELSYILKKNFLSWVTFWKNFLSWVTFWKKNSWVALSTFWKKTSWFELHFGKKLLELSYSLKKLLELSYILKKKLLELNYI